MAASPSLLDGLRALPDVEEAPSQWNRQTAFWIDGREFVHFHADEVEVRLTGTLINRLDDRRVARRTRTSDWVVIPASEKELILQLARAALAANRKVR